MDAYDDLERVLFDVLAYDSLGNPEQESYRWAVEEFQAKQVEFQKHLERRMEFVRRALNERYRYVLPEGCTFEWEETL